MPLLPDMETRQLSDVDLGCTTVAQIVQADCGYRGSAISFRCRTMQGVLKLQQVGELV